MNITINDNELENALLALVRTGLQDYRTQTVVRELVIREVTQTLGAVVATCIARVLPEVVEEEVRDYCARETRKLLKSKKPKIELPGMK